MQEKNQVSQIKSWMRQSITLKLFTISILALCLLIPSSMVKSIIHERQGLNIQANYEVQNKWAHEQTIDAIVVSVPVTYSVYQDKKLTTIHSHHHFLPESLNADVIIEPKTLKRGIYEVVVYTSNIKIDGSFTLPKDFDDTQYNSINWDEAFVTLGISDVRGIQNDIQLDWNGKMVASIPGSRVPELVHTGLTFPLDALKAQKGNTAFKIDMILQGSKDLYFTPLGKTSIVNMDSPWSSPSFDGTFIPDTRNVDNGFTAEWNILQTNRNFPQEWSGNKYNHTLRGSAFGVKLIQENDAYQKSIRSIKYALMNIALTFLVFFIVEVITKSKIHPFQYILVGLSIVLFYILLVSLSEHLGFDRSYLISATAAVSMIYLYSLSVFKSLKFSLYLLGLLVVNFAFVYIILQMTDYALLLGAVTMTSILAIVMYGTRNIDWYNLGKGKEAENQGIAVATKE